MKIRPVVRVSAIKDILYNDQKRLEDALGQTNSKLESLNNGSDVITNLAKEHQLKMERSTVQSQLEELNTKLRVLSHVEAPMIPVEFEV